MDVLIWLQEWYGRHCNGDWETRGGISVFTPVDGTIGWRISITIAETELEGQEIVASTIDRSESDWLSCWTTSETFEIACGPQNLKEGLEYFKSWASL